MIDVAFVWRAVAVCVFAYLVGGIPIGWLLVRWQRFGLDVRGYGSGNIGTSNVYRHAGFDIAVFVGPLQFAQGLVPVLVTRWLGFSVDVAAIAAVCAVIGNGWPVYLRFNGGRGVAVATGAVAGLSVYALLTLLVVCALAALRHRIALGVLVAFVVLPVVASFFIGVSVTLASCAILAVLVLRRLEGVIEDTRAYGHFWRCVYQRVVFDARPGRPLMGRRTDPGADHARG